MDSQCEDMNLNIDVAYSFACNNVLLFIATEGSLPVEKLSGSGYTFRAARQAVLAHVHGSKRLV